MNQPSTLTHRDPPVRLRDRLAFLGPGFILSASIVGSGELIATTVLGAKAGFTALWIIILSCLAKVTVQLEFGRHTILHGETAIQAMNRAPLWRMGRGTWPVWTVFGLTALKIIQVGGILGGAAVVLHMMVPAVPLSAWAALTALSAALLIYNGNYSRVEKISLLMIAVFTALTLAALYALRFTPYAFGVKEWLGGMEFNLSAGVVAIAIGAFGITGVASDEIIAYTYWCMEKGYAAYTGKRDGTAEWKKRAEGWINVMYLDAAVAMLIYTTVTVAFYLLGAAVLHPEGEIPLGNEVINTLAGIYTRTLGESVRYVYLVGAFFVLYSSVFASLAAWTRLFADIAGQLQWVSSGPDRRKQLIAWLAFILPTLWCISYWWIDQPVLMVLSGGIVGSVLLLLVVGMALYFRYGQVQEIPVGPVYRAGFWVSVLSILFVACYGLWSVLGGGAIT